MGGDKLFGDWDNEFIEIGEMLFFDVDGNFVFLNEFENV